MPGQPIFVVARPDGREVWVNFALPNNDRIEVIDTTTGAVTRSLRPGKAVLHMEFTPRGEQVWVSVRDENRVDVYDTRSYEKLAEIAAERPSGIFFSARAHRIGPCSARPAMQQVPRRNGRPSLPAHPGRASLDALDRRLLDEHQRGFPICATPFATLADRLGCEAGEVIRRLAALERRGVVSRVGPVFTPGRIGASTLAAMAVPPRAARSGRGVREPLSRGQSQLRARARAQPVVRARRARRGGARRDPRRHPAAHRPRCARPAPRTGLPHRPRVPPVAPAAHRNPQRHDGGRGSVPGGGAAPGAGANTGDRPGGGTDHALGDDSCDVPGDDTCHVPGNGACHALGDDTCHAPRRRRGPRSMRSTCASSAPSRTVCRSPPAPTRRWPSASARPRRG